MVNCKQVSITKTEGEWLIIEQKLFPDGKDGMKKLSLHIRKEVLKVKNKLKDVPDTVTCLGGKKVEKRPYIDSSVLLDIKLIATRMKVNETTVIDRLIITPLLQK